MQDGLLGGETPEFALVGSEMQIAEIHLDLHAGYSHIHDHTADSVLHPTSLPVLVPSAGAGDIHHRQLPVLLDGFLQQGLLP